MAPITRDETGFSPGAAGASDSRVPGKPTFVSNGTGTITFAVNEAGNDAVVLYAIRKYTAGTLDASPYLQHGSPITFGAAEDWQTAATWGNILIAGLTDFVSYTFDAKSKGDTGVESAFSDQSNSMNTLPTIDEGIETPTEDAEEYFATSANVYVDPTITVTGSSVPETTETDYYGDMTLTYTAYGHNSDDANLQAQFSEYHGSSWDAWAAATIKASPSGDGASGLVTSELGTEHTAVWDGYTDSGESENCPVKLRIRLQDEAGAWSDWVETDEFNYRNLPGELIFTNSGYDWDDVLTPIYVAAMTSLRGGTRAFPTIKIYEKTGLVLIQENKSVESQVGWKYKVGTGAWTQMTAGGIPGATATQIQYTVQTPLTANTLYVVTGIMGETRDLS